MAKRAVRAQHHRVPARQGFCSRRLLLASAVRRRVDMMGEMDGMQPAWTTRDDLQGLGDEDDMDAFNDETFGDGDWDSPAPMNDISDLSAMTLDKAQLLQEAVQKSGGTSVGGGDMSFPALPMAGASLLGGPGIAKPMAPPGLMTPQMMMQVCVLNSYYYTALRHRWAHDSGLNDSWLMTLGS